MRLTGQVIDMTSTSIMMNKKEILKKVGGILAELNEQYQYLSQSPDNLNDLELELFSANANFLSDHLSILVKINDNVAKSSAETKAGHAGDNNQVEKEEAKDQTKVADVEISDDSKSDLKFELDKRSEPTFELEDKPKDRLFDQPLTAEEKTVIDEETILKSEGEKEETNNDDFEDDVADEKVEVQIPDLKESETDLHVKEVIISERTIAVPAEPVYEEKPLQTVNDLLSKNISTHTIASQYNTRSQQDLKGMVSLNDKLLFVRDLFNGYSLAYSEAMELLNRFDSFESADNFLKQNYASKNNWADKQDVTDKFYEILSRRFSK